jgi:iduronate 2-sulfatase
MKLTRTQHILSFFALIMALTLGLISCGSKEKTDQNPGKPNVLFIIIDDMNADINSYDGPIISPNIDELAQSGIMFRHAYVQQPVCAASRASFLTGLRPNSTGVDYPYSHYFMDEILPTYGTISRFFAGNGFDVKQFGKVHHGIEDENPTFLPKKKPGRYYNDSLNLSLEKGGAKLPYEKSYDGDSEYIDFKIADSVATAILDHDASSEPFFFIAGFKKPHLIFAAPEKYWDLYDEDQIALPKPKNLAAGSPDYAVERYYLKQYDWETKNPNTPFTDEYAKLIRHAYYATSSFVDAQVGLVMDALKKSGLEEETIVLFVSDHGFLIGEHNYWGKTNLFEKGLQVPLLVSWKDHIKAGQETNALVEAVDIFPTLADLAGLEVPEYLEGNSFKPVIQDPERPWKTGVLSQQPRGIVADREGTSMRTSQYRYTEWISTFTGEILAQELFDYELDPTESVNLATRPENAEFLNKLSVQLNAGWKSMLPEDIRNPSSNPLAPPSYAWGKEGVSRRAGWHAKFGGTEEEGWRKATELRKSYQEKHDQ